MNKLKVMTIVGTRPEVIRLSRVLPLLDTHCNHILVHTGQNYDYELNQIFFEDLGLRKPDYILNVAGKNGAETIGKTIIETDKVFETIKPDAVLILGDTNSSMAALSAKRRKIPIFHMEAGNRCFDMRVPEEINRKIVDHISDINLPYSSIAREYLLREGLPPDQIIKTGSPMYEVLEFYRNKIEASNALNELGLKQNSYFLVSVHREENIESPEQFIKLIQLLNGLATRYNLPIVISTHPRTQKKINENKVSLHHLIQLIKPLGFCDYNKLQLNAKVCLSDSGTISEESSILNFPALNLREAHERPEAMEEAAVMMVGLNLETVTQAIDILSIQHCGTDNKQQPIHDYNTPNVSQKIVRILYSYTDYINRKVWMK
jgi:UDP-N-acetylglucosamine 2-epimerase